MKTIKEIYESIILDSRIDFPQETLCNDVWDKKDDTYILKGDVRDVILNAVQCITKEAIFNNINDIRIVGSICSNQYTLSSDIDVHFLIKDFTKNISSDELNKKLKEFISSNNTLKDLFIVTHPVQFYFQFDEFQDLMSTGVYDIENNEWIVGPTEVKLDFNPYDEFKDAFPIIGEYIKRIDEQFDIIKKCINDDKLINNCLNGAIKKLLIIKKELKEYRRSFSSPTSKEEADEFRNDKEWHKIDAVFKFIDKFGYLKKITLIEKLVKDKKITNNIIAEIKNIL